MIFHSSIAAAEPERVARVIAELWRGTVRRAPKQVFEECYVAFALDERGTQIEVFPHSFAFVPPSKTNETKDYDQNRKNHIALTATHYAIATPLADAEVHGIARREQWECATCRRDIPGGGYGVVELWLENRQMIEVLTPEMQEQYAHTMAAVRKNLM